MTKKTIHHLVMHSAIRVIELDKLGVDPAYQRDVKKGHERIVANFKREALGILVVGEREDASLWIVDGQQRATALRKLRYKVAKCEVFRSSGVEHEAEVFRWINFGRTKLNTYEQFRSLLAQGDKVAWAIKEAVEAEGFRLHLAGGGRSLHFRGLKAKDLVCVGTLYRIAKPRGKGAGEGSEPLVGPIRFALSMANQAWPEDRAGIGNAMIGGMASWYRRQGDAGPNIDRLLPRLKVVTPQNILHAANQASLGGSRESAVADQIERVFRKRLMTK